MRGEGGEQPQDGDRRRQRDERGEACVGASVDGVSNLVLVPCFGAGALDTPGGAVWTANRPKEGPAGPRNRSACDAARVISPVAPFRQGSHSGGPSGAPAHSMPEFAFA